MVEGQNYLQDRAGQTKGMRVLAESKDNIIFHNKLGDSEQH